MKTNHNVILITVDCLRADHIGCLGYAKNTTPNVDFLTTHCGASFSTAFSNGPCTTSSVASLLTGTYPIYKDNVLINDRPTIAEILKKNGYKTAAFHSNVHLSRFSDYKKGFDTFDDMYFSSEKNAKIDTENKSDLKKIELKMLRFAEEKIKKRYLFRNIMSYLYCKIRKNIMCSTALAKEINNGAISWLDDCHSPFFLWLHYMDTHVPYHPPESYFKEFSNEKYDINRGIYLHVKALDNYYKLSTDEKKYLIDMYDAGIKNVDCAIKEVMEYLEQNDLDKNTYVILTADHGEELWDHGHFGHVGSVRSLRPLKLYDESIHVPLIFLGHSVKVSTINQPISLLDITPTILDLLDIPKLEKYDGKSLTPFLEESDDAIVLNENKNNYPIITEAIDPGDPIYYSKSQNRSELYSYRINHWKYIHYTSPNRTDELYDVIDDPKETINLIDTHTDIAQELKSKVITHIKSKNKKNVKIITKNKIKELKKIRKI